MSNATIQPLQEERAGLWERMAALWETRPKSKSLRAQALWLWMVIKLLSRRNVNWFLSAGIHAVVLLSVAGFALHSAGNIEGVAIESSNVGTLAEQAFDNVSGSDVLQMGGGGKGLEDSLQSSLGPQAVT